MNPIDWLCKYSPGFNALAKDEIEAIMHFSLIWSFFEAEALETNASAKNIHNLILKWKSADCLHRESFAPSLAYFRNRYFKQGKFTEYFDGLRLRGNDKPELVSAVLNGENKNTEECITALLIIVFRLRNNLFHGVKWAYNICGQHDNFENANAVLVAALETHNRFLAVGKD